MQAHANDIICLAINSTGELIATASTQVDELVSPLWVFFTHFLNKMLFIHSVKLCDCEMENFIQSF